MPGAPSTITLVPGATPTVCARAAIGAATAAATMATARMLFRMGRLHFGHHPHPMTSAAHRSPVECVSGGTVASNMEGVRNPTAIVGVSYLGTCPAQRFPLPDSLSPHHPENFNGYHRCPRPCPRGPDCRHFDPDHAAASQFHRCHLPDFHRPRRPRPVAVDPLLASESRNPPACAGRPKMV